MPSETETTETTEVNDRRSLLEATRKVLLAGIGAVALAQDEIEGFIGKLVERGEIAEQDGKRLFSEIMDKRKKSADKAEDEFTKRIEEILDRMNVPTKEDINKLGQKITNLTKKVDELKKAQTE
jgi:poly(hydroxyalkanoate) granule-associated protein